MTKAGYTHIIVSTDLHNQLKQLSKKEGVSISKLIERQFSININGQNTLITPTNTFSKEAQNESDSQNGFSVNAFPKRVELVPRPGFEPGTIRFLCAW